MPRARKGAARTQAHKRVRKEVKGYQGARRTQWRRIQEARLKAGAYAYRDRRNRKRDFRRLWITRISAACEINGIKYSVFMNGLKKANIELNRKMLSEIAIHDAEAFSLLVEKAKAAL